MASNETKWNSIVVDNESHDLRFSMTIKNFMDNVCKPGERLESLQMQCAQRCGAKWRLSIYAYGQSEEDKDNIGISLELVDKPLHAETVTARYEIYIVGQGGRKIKIDDIMCRCVEHELKIGFGLDKLKRSEIEDNLDLYLPNGHLTIRCEGREFLNKPHQTLSIESFPQVADSSQYNERVKKLYQDRICCDVILKSGSREFKCHKAIRAVNSAYFKAMFEHDMKENRENVVDVSKDLNGEELKALLDYIYLGTEKLPTLSTASYQTLFRVSDMYEIQGLKDVCESLLIRKRNFENAMDLLIFSDQFGAKRLKKAAASVIANSSD